MQGTSQLLLRNPGRLPAGPLALVDPPRDDFAGTLSRRPGTRLTLHCQDYGDFAWHRAAGMPVEFGIVPGMPFGRSGAPVAEPQMASASALARGTTEQRGDIILFQPREKERLAMLVHAVSEQMPAGAALWLVGENRAGIKSCRRHLTMRFGQVEQVDAARHCTLYRALAARSTETFRLEPYAREWTLELPPTDSAGEMDTLRLVSLPGTFAHGRLDVGTALLLDYLAMQPVLQGEVLDFGCGVGVIGLGVLSRSSGAGRGVRLTLVDSSAIGLEAARRSLAANGLDARLQPADGIEDLSGAFDWIVSNPPFHRGVATEFDIARRLFANAPRILAPGGRLVLVCNRHLPYADWLDERYGQVDCPVQNRAFRVLVATTARS